MEFCVGKTAGGGNSEFRIRDSGIRDSGFGIRDPPRGRRDWHGPQATGSQHSWHYIPFCSQARRQREGIRIPAGFGLGEPEKATRPDSDSLPCPVLDSDSEHYIHSIKPSNCKQAFHMGLQVSQRK